MPARQLTEAEVGIKASPQILAKLGEAGDIVLFKGDAGWLVALCKRDSKKLLPTDVRYSYGD